MNTFFTSDWHLGHQRILEICERGFNSIEEHDEEIIFRHNSMISDSDTFYNLGDVGYKIDVKHLVSFLYRFNGAHKIILGNHDKALRQAFSQGLLNQLINSGKIEIIGGNEAIQDKMLSTYKMIKVDGQRIFIGHYALRSWPSAFRDVWHLYGHSHGNLSSYYKSFDVGVDSHKYYPCSMNTIRTYMNSVRDAFKEDKK